MKANGNEFQHFLLDRWFYVNFRNGCRMLPGPVTCLCVNDDQLMFGGSLLGNIGVSGLRSDQRVVMLRSRNTVGHI